MQAVWRWLWNSKNSIKKEHRTLMTQAFRKMLYSDTTEEAQKAFNSTLDAGSRNNHWKHKERWCLAWRDHHTNNYSEMSVRIFKENVLCRVKAYNVISLIDFVAQNWKNNKN